MKSFLENTLVIPLKRKDSIFAFYSILSATYYLQDLPKHDKN